MAAKLISAGNFRWLFAETLVIVLGVLIALGLNDYWTDRQDRLLAIDYIQRIEYEVNGDLQNLQNSFRPRLRAKREALEAILPVVRGRAPVPEDLNDFLLNVSRGGIFGGTLATLANNTTFEELRATGNLRLIRDPDLRIAIVRYYADGEYQINRLRGRFTDYVSFVLSVIPGELRDDMDLDAINEFGVEFAMQRLLSEEFRRLANEEYNKMLFMENFDWQSPAESLLGQLGAYRLKLEGS